MPEQLLNVPQPGAVVEHVGRRRVPEQVGVQTLESGESAASRHDVADHLG
jgi:hypothetical protein